MLITIYFIVATLNVLAQHNNYGINVKHTPDFDIRVRRHVGQIENIKNENIFDEILEYINEELFQESKSTKLIELIQNGIDNHNDLNMKHIIERKYDPGIEEVEENMHQHEELVKGYEIRKRRQTSSGYYYTNNVQNSGYNYNSNHNSLYNKYNTGNYNSYGNSLYNPYNNSGYNNMYNGNSYPVYTTYNDTHYIANGYLNAYLTPKSQPTNTGYGYTEAIPYNGYNEYVSTSTVQTSTDYNQQVVQNSYYTTPQTYYRGYNTQLDSFYTASNPLYSQSGYFVPEKPTDLYSQNQGYIESDYTGYNNTIEDHNENDYKNTNKDDLTTTTPMVIVQSCILCSLGIRKCPVDQRRVGMYCVPRPKRP